MAALAGRYALAVPLVETILGHWLLSQAGLEGPEGPGTVVSAWDKARGRSATTPFLAAADWVVAVMRDDGGRGTVCLFDPADGAIEPRPSLANEGTRC